MNKTASEPKKRIVLVSNLNFRYQANHPLELAEVFAALGYDVSIIAPIPDDVVHFHEARGFKIICRSIPAGRLGMALFMIFAIYRIVIMKPDLIIGINQLGYIPAWLASRVLLRSILIYWAMELSRLVEDEQGFATRFQVRFAHQADMVLSTGVERAKVMKEDWHLKEIPYVLPNTIVIPNKHTMGNDLRSQMENLQPNDKIVLYASSLSPQTAIPQVIESVKYWEAGIKLAIVGYGSEQFLKQMKQHIEQLNLEKKIEYLGSFLLKSDVFRLLPDADLGLVLRNHRNASDANTIYYTPSKLFEYTAFGVPVICSDNPSLLFIEHEGWGACVDPDDPKLIASKINQLIGDRESLERMGMQAKRRFDEEYCMEVQGRRLMDLFQSRGFLTKLTILE